MKNFSHKTAAGYKFKYITPEAGLHYYHIQRDSYNDSAAQHVKGANTDYLRANIGVRFATEYQQFEPYIYLGMNYDVVSPKNNTVVNLTNGSNYTVEGRRLSRAEGIINVGLMANVADDVTVGASYMGAYRSDYQEHTGMIKVKYDF